MNIERQAGTKAATLMLHKFKRPASFFAMLLLVAVFVSSCDDKPDLPTLPPNSLNVGGRQYEILIIDSCEYISYNVGTSWSMFSHKGNCKFCAVRHSH